MQLPFAGAQVWTRRCQGDKMNPKVDFFFKKADKWQEEFQKLRTIILDCQLTEELKWGQPCYTFQKKKHRSHSWIQRVLCASVLQRCLVKGCRWYSHSTNGESAGGAADSVHQCSRNR